MKTHKSSIIITGIITILPLFIGLLLWPQLPDTIATHFGTDNTPNGWSSKLFAVFCLPIFMLIVHLICIFSVLSDPKTKNISNKLFTLLLWLCPAISLTCSLSIYGYALNQHINVGLLANLLAGIILIAIGNYLPTCRQNFTAGLRTPWALNSEQNWIRTHHFAGWLWILGGTAFLVNSIFLTLIIIPVIIVMVLLPIIYSFILYKKGI